MFPALIDKLIRREDLTSDEASAAMNEVMEGRAAAAQLSGLLVGLAMKGERPAEIVGLARAMRAHAVRLSARFEDVFDTCGTGGDRSGTFNISTCAALVVAASGVRVAKHGNRSVSSRSGSADVFEALGVGVTAPPAVVERCLSEVGIGFFFAPTFHPAMRHAAQARRELGVRTAFNLLGPLTNPAGAARQIVGVPRPEFTELVARALLQLGSERAWVVHGADGIDEISPTGYTKVSECRDGTVHTFYLHPSDVGLPKASARDIAGGDATENARIITQYSGWRPRRSAGRGAPERGRRPVRGGHRAVRRARHCPGGRRDRRWIGLGRVEAARIGVELAGRRSGSMNAPADLLATIVAATRRTVEVRQDREPLAALARRAEATPLDAGRFRAALGRPERVNVIAECKRRSPSRGVLVEAYDPAAIAKAYERGGAAAISCLTEPCFFDGALEHLAAVAYGRHAPDPAQGLHRFGVPALRSACRRRRRRPAHRRRAPAGRAGVALEEGRRGRPRRARRGSW